MSTEALASAAAPTYPEGTPVPLSVDLSGNLRTSGSGSVPAGAATSANQVIQTTALNSIITNTGAATPAGTNVIGHVITDSGSVTVATGNVTAGTADSGNPVKVGGIYNTTPITLAPGQRGDINLDSSGSVRARMVVSAGSGVDGFVNTAVGFTSSTLIQSDSRLLATGPSIFNGTSWDRLRSGGVTGMLGVSNQASSTGGYSYNHIATATTTTVKSGVGTLHSVTINSLGTVASTLTVYDSTTGSGTVIAIINSLSITGTLTFDVAFTTGLTIVSTGTVAPDITVSYK